MIIFMSTVHSIFEEIAESFKDKLNSLLENDTNIDVNSTDELIEKVTKYTQEEILNEE